MSRKHVFQTILRAVAYILGICFNLGLLVLTVYAIYIYSGKGFGYGKEYAEKITVAVPPQDIEVEIPENASVAEVADILERDGVIRSAILFQVENMLKGGEESFNGGTFTLNTTMDSSQINAALQASPVTNEDYLVITIKEGYTAKDIATYLESQEILKAEDFLNACRTGWFDYGFLRDIPERENRLEGYLFPDTYFISKEPTAEEIIHKMLTRFEEIYDLEYETRAEQMNLTMDQVITMASIIEKEIRVAEERAEVSAIIYNRLELDMPLQMCSTVLYVLDKRKDWITDEDLAVESPYNTYIHTGFPVGPIANPGEACIRAALYPNESDSLYFVVKNTETGAHFFTSDYDAFVAAKIEYKQNY